MFCIHDRHRSYIVLFWPLPTFVRNFITDRARVSTNPSIIADKWGKQQVSHDMLPNTGQAGSHVHADSDRQSNKAICAREDAMDCGRWRKLINDG